MSYPKKIIVFEQNIAVRDLLQDILEEMDFVRERNYFVEALPEPWNAKDQVDYNTALVLVGHYPNQNTEWDALSYVKNVPECVPIIAGCAFWDEAERNVFVRAGVQFTYDKPCKKNGLESMIKAALKVGSALKMLSKDKTGLVVTHLYSDKETLSVYKIPKK